MKALNFYSTVYQANLLAAEKRCTIRLGDKRDKYREGDLVWVTYGNRYEPRQKLFTAVIDRVVVKRLGDLTTEELRAEDANLKDPAELARFLERIYDRPVAMDETVSAIFFSRVLE
ncbi:MULTISPECIES: ASCH domain-containing protein [Thermaerobacter]|uniref:RNA-binding protein n=1 Tax=Thermaerobacter composti TaxID=554949 RepID=A0ABZ0QQM4_9FIRM|nr:MULTISPECIES: RNA-binding protein [Thermaerobacter]PZN06458.1 MAG: RNA-binding protein [Bacillota bacterium]QBS37662.1 RNA-binding protein [Thermaerobacter sp. FW80]WPD19798.1 RNA-binding protein [Thermaerobacter composti]